MTALLASLAATLLFALAGLLAVAVLADCALRALAAHARLTAQLAALAQGAGSGVSPQGARLRQQAAAGVRAARRPARRQAAGAVAQPLVRPLACAAA